MKHPTPPLKLTFAGIGLASLLLLPSPRTMADVLGSFVIHGDGTVTYFYNVDNSAGLFDVAAWSLEFDVGAPDWNPLDVFSGGDVAVPDPIWFADLGVPITGASAQDFLSLDPTGDVAVGSMLAGFSFTSSFLPGPVTYHEFSASGESATGTTIGPATLATTIPEAGGWVGASGLAVLTLLGMKLRWRAAAAV